MKLSVTVLTSPGREKQLGRCLEMLRRQSWPWFEVIVIDDGSVGGKDLTAAFAGHLELRHLWRPNDGSPARSRNLGAGLARHDGLVFLDGDMLPNPLALEIYAEQLEAAPEAAVYGYTGNLGPPSLTSSLWFPEAKVMICDSRFCFRSATRLAYVRELESLPQNFAWSGSFALRAELFNAVGGFDESFSGWGHEDMEFAHRLAEHQIRIDFSLDAWSENQVHPQHWRRAREEGNQDRLPPFSPSAQPPRISYNPGRSQLGRLLAEHYVPRMEQPPKSWEGARDEGRGTRDEGKTGREEG